MADWAAGTGLEDTLDLEGDTGSGTGLAGMLVAGSLDEELEIYCSFDI